MQLKPVRGNLFLKERQPSNPHEVITHTCKTWVQSLTYVLHKYPNVINSIELSNKNWLNTNYFSSYLLLNRNLFKAIKNSKKNYHH